MERYLGPGAHQAHIPFEHIEKLGQFVQTEFADKTAEPGLARVLGAGPAGLLVVVDAHGAELVHQKGPLVQPHPLLLENDRPRTGQLDADSHGQHQRAGQHNKHQTARHIHRPFEKGVEQIVKGGLPHIDQLALVQHINGGAGGQVIVVKGHHGDAQALLVAGGDGFGQKGDLIGLQRQNHFVVAAGFQLSAQVCIAAQAGDRKRRLGAVAQVTVHLKTVVGVVFQRAQILGRGGPAAHQQNMADAKAAAALGAVVPALEHPAEHHKPGGQQIEKSQHHTGVVVQPQQIQRRHIGQQAARIDQRHRGAALAEPAQAAGVVHAGDPIGQHDGRCGQQAGQPVAGVPGDGQCGACAAGLEKAHIVEPQIICQQKGAKYQRRVQQRIENDFKAAVLTQHGLLPPSGAAPRGIRPGRTVYLFRIP